MVIGALGRCGTGARDALTAAGCDITAWDVAETRMLDRPRLLEHDLLVNAVLSTADVPGIDIAGVTVDAGPVNSPVLMQIGSRNGNNGARNFPMIVKKDNPMDHLNAGCRSY